MASTLKRPPEIAVQRFHAGQAGDDTIETYLKSGYSLAICCKACPRLVEWTPSDLKARFGGTLQLRIADPVPKLACTGAGGCGSREIAVFPHFYDGPWCWPRAEG